MKDGQKIFFRGEGDQQPDLEPGDVIIILNEKPHDVFQRSGDDLLMNRTISLTEALCGFSFVIRHLDGRDLLIKHPPGDVVKPGDLKAVMGEGMPFYKNHFEKGNLYITFEITFPENNFADEKTLKSLETILPARPAFTKPEGENVEEVELYPLDPSSDKGAAHGSRGEAYASDDEDHIHGPGIQCAQQ